MEGARVGTACRFNGVGGSGRGRGMYCLLVLMGGWALDEGSVGQSVLEVEGGNGWERVGYCL